jgi:iduronate 2-sulfatase
VTLPQWFKEHRYETRDAGKIFHNWHTKEKGDRRSWSADEFLHYAMHQDDKPEVKGELPPDLAKAPKCECRDVPDNTYYDGRVAAEAVRVLKDVKDKPFFLAVGFWKPHAPFNAPKKYWDLYDRDKLPTFDPARPKDAPELAFHDGRELRGIPPKQVTFTAAEAREIRHGYFANISYMDAQVGKVLAALDELTLREKTIVVFMADHGYHVGEHELWAKTSNFELDARVPLVVSVPRNVNVGKASSSLVELVDLFPTLNDLCGLPAMKGMDGTSLRPILEDPKKQLKTAAFTQHPRPAYPDRTEKGVPDAMGYSVRTEKIRYTEWRDWESGKLLGRELYDHTSDPGETRNVVDFAKDPLVHTRGLLHKQFPPDVPPAKR